jgi:hypothetical protein
LEGGAHKSKSAIICTSVAVISDTTFFALNIENTGRRSFNVKIAANITFGEVHEKSGLEGTGQKQIDRRVKVWLRGNVFRWFANAVGCSSFLISVKKCRV